MGVEISEIATASYTEGVIDAQNNSRNGTTSCFNVTGSQPHVERCLARSTLDVKFVTSGLMVALGFFDAMVALCSIIAARDIFLYKYNPRHGQQTIRMQETDMPRMTVSEFFEQRMQVGQPNSVTNQVDYGTNHVENSGTILANSSPTDLPDSDQFRLHLEGLDGENHRDLPGRQE